MKRYFILIASAVIGLSAMNADATLIPIGSATYDSSPYSLVYDDTPGLVWLDYSHDGLDNTWDEQMNWASSLNGAGVLTYNINSGVNVSWTGDWRLPHANPATPEFVYGEDGSTSGGYNITSSELGHLYYHELGNQGFYDVNGNDVPNWGFNNSGPFANLQPAGYWTGTEYGPDNNDAWDFYMNDGYQDEGSKMYDYLGVAVRSANVTTSSVPEPGTMLLLGSGVAAFIAARKKLLRKSA